MADHAPKWPSAAAIVSLTLVLIVAGCAPLPRDCAGLMPMTKTELFFGRNIGVSEGVTDAEWQRFLDEEITARFPDGLTVLTSAGQWRQADGRIITERGFVVAIFAPDSEGAQHHFEAIRGAYRTRFSQESVLLAQARVCADY
jgi:hypothetical protein